MEVITQKIADGIVITLQKPGGEDKKPVIVLCHGFCGIREILLPAFAQAFAEAGFAAITFDYHGFGDSDGERGRLVPAMQIADILTVVRWAQQQPALDAQRIGLWGTSFGGCHVFGAAAQMPEIKCLVSQLAFADGEAIVSGHMDQQEKNAFIATLDKMVEKQKTSGKEMMVSVNRVLSDAESKAFFAENRALYPKMDIKIPFLTVRETLQYKPALAAAQVKCPSLVVIAEKDSVNPPEQGRALFAAIGAQEKELYQQADARHYDIYTGAHFQQVIRVQTAWFEKYL